MPKPKQKTEVALLEPLDTLKPLVKDFFDPEKDLLDFVLLRLPHISNTEVSLKQVYQSKNKMTFRYRVNYWRKEMNDVGLTSGSIVKSSMIQVDDSGEGFVFSDVTDSK